MCPTENNAVSSFRQAVETACAAYDQDSDTDARRDTDRRLAEAFEKLFEEDRERALEELPEIPHGARPLIRDILLKSPQTTGSLDSATVRWIVATSNPRDEELFFVKVATAAAETDDRNANLDRTVEIVRLLEPTPLALQRVTSCLGGIGTLSRRHLTRIKEIGFEMCAVLGDTPDELKAKEDFVDAVLKFFPYSRKARAVRRSVEHIQNRIWEEERLASLKNFPRPTIPADRSIREYVYEIEAFSLDEYDDYLDTMDPDIVESNSRPPGKETVLEEETILVAEGDDQVDFGGGIFGTAISHLSTLLANIDSDIDRLDWSCCKERLGLDGENYWKFVEPFDFLHDFLSDQDFDVSSNIWSGGGPGMSGCYYMVFVTKERGAQFIIDVWHCFRSLRRQVEEQLGPPDEDAEETKILPV